MSTGRVEAGALPLIRRARIEDAAPLAVFGARVFAETFGPHNRPEDMAEFLAAVYGEARQAAELRDPTVMTLVAERDGVLAAFAQLRANYTPPCVQGPAPIEVQRFYVDRPWQGSGLAQRLMAAVRDAARERGARTLWLAVWERNPRAIAFYGKEGFVDVGAQEFVLGRDRQTDRVMAAALEAE